MYTESKIKNKKSPRYKGKLIGMMRDVFCSME